MMLLLFRFLQTSILNKHLQELMDGLTAKVFRTYNASITLQQQLKELTSRKHAPTNTLAAGNLVASIVRGIQRLVSKPHSVGKRVLSHTSLFLLFLLNFVTSLYLVGKAAFSFGGGVGRSLSDVHKRQVFLSNPIPADENIPAKILSYNRANRAVAILCNHQRAAPKTFEKSMQTLQGKVSRLAGVHLVLPPPVGGPPVCFSIHWKFVSG